MHLLEPDQEQAAWRAIVAIARDLAALAPSRSSGAREASLASGDAGIALFFEMLSRTERGEGIGASALADEYLGAALDALGEQSLDPSLFAGFSGVAWVFALLCRERGEEVGSDLDAVDEALAQYVARNASAELDLITGSVGIGAYLLERLPRPLAQEGIAEIVRALERAAEERDGLVTWRTPANALDDADRRLYPEGRYDLGVAHGVPGTIAFLARVCAAGIEKARSERLLEGALAWLARQATKGSPSPRFPYWKAAVGPSPATRLSWCYGDLGIALALLSAATAIRRTDLWDEAVELAHAVADRAPESAGIVDAGLCHGTAGAAHQFHRLHEATREPKFSRVSRFWFEQTLAARREGEGVGGFRAVVRDANLNDVWLDEPEFLNGAAGIGLALLSALTPDEPFWDRALLISPLASERPDPPR
ncbi:MAG TPA: lanthionine synthetase C family protein [Polyangiaceae bacterium]|nr:lanthionine synthetase C family protein [Polyangiaceae bacterium]